jgi:hypothetical protein
MPANKTKQWYAARNEEIRRLFAEGRSRPTIVDELCEAYGLKTQRVYQILDIPYGQWGAFVPDSNGHKQDEEPVVIAAGLTKGYWVTCGLCKQSRRYSYYPNNCANCASTDLRLEVIDCEVFRSEYR